MAYEDEDPVLTAREALRERVLQASEVAVRRAEQYLKAVCASAAATPGGAKAAVMVGRAADLLMREIQTQKDVARILGDQDWQRLAALRAKQHRRRWEEIARKRQADALHPSEMYFEDLPKLEEVQAIPVEQIEQLEQVAETVPQRWLDAVTELTDMQERWVSP